MSDKKGNSEQYKNLYKVKDENNLQVGKQELELSRQEQKETSTYIDRKMAENQAMKIRKQVIKQHHKKKELKLK